MVEKIEEIDLVIWWSDLKRKIPKLINSLDRRLHWTDIGIVQNVVSFLAFDTIGGVSEDRDWQVEQQHSGETEVNGFRELLFVSHRVLERRERAGASKDELE